MRMLYAYIGSGIKRTSVREKVINVIAQLQKANIDVRGCVFSSEVSSVSKLNDLINIMPVKKTEKKYFKSWNQHQNNLRAIIDYLDESIHNYDVVYFRYPGACKLLVDLTRKFGDKIVFEHNSKELNELKLSEKEYPFGVTPSKFLTWYQYARLFVYNEKKWSGEVLANAKMGVAVTDDIAMYEKERAQGDYYCVSSPNGVDVEKVKFRKPIDIQNDTINIALVSGANTAAPYIGIDRIFDGLKAYQGSTKINLFCVGRIFLKEQWIIDAIESMPNVHTEGVFDNEELDVFYDKIHLCIGSVGLHRIGMKQGSVLKVVDSLSRGIPVVVAHEDMELVKCEEYSSFIYRAPPDDTPLSFSEIIDFHTNLSKDKNHSLKIRNLALNHTDLKGKLTILMDKISCKMNV